MRDELLRIADRIDAAYEGAYMAGISADLRVLAAQCAEPVGVFVEQMDMLREDFAKYCEGDPTVPFVVVRDALTEALNAYDEVRAVIAAPPARPAPMREALIALAYEAAKVLQAVADSGVSLPSNWRWPLIDELGGAAALTAPPSQPVALPDGVVAFLRYAAANAKVSGGRVYFDDAQTFRSLLAAAPSINQTKEK